MATGFSTNSRAPAHSERRLQRGLEVGIDSFSDNAGQGASASPSHMLRHRRSALVLSLQQQHPYFSLISCSASAAELASTAISISGNGICTAAAHQRYLDHPQQQLLRRQQPLTRTCGAISAWAPQAISVWQQLMLQRPGFGDSAAQQYQQFTRQQ